MSEKPWDARLAYQLIYPLRNSRVTPDHLTCARLAFGMLAAGGFATGDYLWSNLGALSFITSSFLDHADGELARLTNQCSESGHKFDLFSDALVNVSLFVGIGFGLQSTELGFWALPMGVISGIAVAAIFQMRNEIEKTLGRTGARQPHFLGMEAEDVLYLLPVVCLFDWLHAFLILATVGAPAFSVWVWKEYTGLTNK